ncbi:MAG: hypothetical protein HC916_10410 [Coleofasciculaceae cyanobacterium SM2_1_6]|nr:hypothetical protein [Coleofasciculaceae cyanobacterium SM2_1_6]
MFSRFSEDSYQVFGELSPVIEKLKGSLEGLSQVFLKIILGSREEPAGFFKIFGKLANNY